MLIVSYFKFKTVKLLTKKTAKSLLRLVYFLYSILYFLRNYTLNLKCITSPSLTIYSFPSTLNFPASLHLASEPKLE